MDILYRIMYIIMYMYAYYNNDMTIIIIMANVGFTWCR
jgi:hypothetical protein